MSHTPSDEEIVALARSEGIKVRTGAGVVKLARAVLAKWGTPPAVAGEPFCYVSVNKQGDITRTIKRKDKWTNIPLYTTPQPTQAQAGAVPLTPIRQAALDLYTPPFRHEYGYIRDANNQIVSDDASSVATGLIAARIRGWGRIQYMDKPEMRANALQDEVAEIVAEALNAYWSTHGIKGGQHGADT